MDIARLAVPKGPSDIIIFKVHAGWKTYFPNPLKPVTGLALTEVSEGTVDPRFPGILKQ